MGISSKHHYLPEFYLKGFVNSFSRFVVYDVRRRVMKKGDYHPSTHFFIKDRNTVSHEGMTSDYPEHHYSKQDDGFSKLFRKIQSTEGVPLLDATEMFTLQWFLANIFWRIPKNDDLYKTEFRNNPLFYKAYKFRDRTTGEEVHNEITRKILSSDALRISSKVLAPGLSLMGHESSDLHNWRITYAPGDFNFCSDSPFVLKDGNAKDLFETDFIFPLTKNHTLVRTSHNLDNAMGALKREFGVMMSTVILKQAEFYCAGPRRDILSAISSLDDKFQPGGISKRLFDYLSGCEKK